MKYCDYIFSICLDLKDWLNIWISVAALLISALSLIITIRYASKSFRPIISIAVRTHSSGNLAATFDLVISNSGSIPAKEIKLIADNSMLQNALGTKGTNENQEKWFYCFSEKPLIPLLQNGDEVSCSFGFVESDGEGFWKYGSIIPVTIKYKSWFGKRYSESQIIHIKDSRSFTGFQWSASS